MLCKKNVHRRGMPETLQSSEQSNLELPAYWFRQFQVFVPCMVFLVSLQVLILQLKRVIGHKYGWLTVG